MDHAIVNSRELAFPPERVFAAFSDPGQLAAWWGPQGFTNSFEQFDFTPGGAWRFTMRGPDGTAYPMSHRFTEIVAARRIAFRHLQAGHDFTLEVAFAAKAGGTTIVWRMTFDDPAEGERLRDFLGPANDQNLDRLVAHLSAGAGSVR